MYASLTVLVGLVFFVGYVAYLDREVRAKFEGKRFELPARVFARPLELYPGKALLQSQLRTELDLLGYKVNAGELQPGQYQVSGATVLVYVRAFDFWDGTQPAQLVHITFKQNEVATLLSTQTQTTIDLLRFDPLEIGGIYPQKNEDRRLVRFNDVPRHFVDALVSVEDQRFYLHHGVDPRAIARAFVATVSGKAIQGGSTITQQLVKNFYLTPERTIKRKLNEMIMALLLEWHYTKNDIIETYMNEVYFGQDGTRAVHGVGLAAQYYYGVSVTQLQPHQSAMLVALLKGPVYYNPRKHPKRALARRNLVLQQTYDQGFLPEWEYKAAIQSPLSVVAQADFSLTQYPAFIDWVVRQLRRDYKESDLRTEGLRIFSTLDPVVQRRVEASVHTRLPNLEQTYKLPKDFLEAAAVVSSRHTGEVEAVVGGRNPRFQGFNRALDAKRPVGSVFKPVVYLTALLLKDGFNLATLLDDSPLSWQEPGAPLWEPQNYDKAFHGQVPAWQALAKSYNVATARLGLEVGINNIIEVAHKLGVRQTLTPYASTTLGASELPLVEVAQMYQTLAAGGFRLPLRTIREVTTRDGVPLKRYGIDVKLMVNEQATYLVNRALEVAISHGTGAGLRRYLPDSTTVAGKTGTTDDTRDSWFAGFGHDHVAVVWVGNDDNLSIRMTGASGAMSIWGTIMQDTQTGPLALTLPTEVTERSIDANAGSEDARPCHEVIQLPFVAEAEPQDAILCGNTSAPIKDRVRSWWRRLLD